jgi:hypothetical protein
VGQGGFLKNSFFPTGGGGEIRTHEGIAPLTVFKTVPLSLSGTPPFLENYHKSWLYSIKFVKF